jgi:class 3 adenylate cyclase
MGIIWLFEELRKVYREEFSEYSIEEGDPLILVPLGTGPYRRLGCIVLWAPSDILEECIAQPTKLEGIIGFRKGIEQLLIRLFTNFYHMASHTYLPSYYQIEQKPVALLCTEIREFDRISETLRLRRDFTREEAAECLRRLVNLFTQTTAQVIEKHRGRVDQIWGNGLLAIFGEYLDTPEPSSRVACMRATIAAAELVEKFREVAESWLKTVFKMEKFQQTNNELITLVPAVAVDYGEVVFDYVGSAKHRVYMAIGDHINFVKQLTSMAGRTERDHSAPEFLLHQILALTRREAKNPDELFYLVAPILLSQAAYAGARHILSERDGTFNGSLRRGRSISLPGRFTPYLVHELWPENVDRTAS